MTVKSKSQSIQNVRMFNIFLLESLDASCKAYLISLEISSVGTLSYDWPKTNYTTVQAEIDEVALLYAPVLLLRVRSIGKSEFRF